MVALENARLYSRMQEMAITDGLTGIYNRGHLNLLMDQFSKAGIKDRRRCPLLYLILTISSM